MTAVLLAFPRCRDVAFVRRHADHLLSFSSPRSAERYLQQQLRIQAQAMARKGLQPWVVDYEVKALEAAIRAALYHPQVSPGGAA